VLDNCESLADHVKEVDVTQVDFEGLVLKLRKVEQVKHQNAHKLRGVLRFSQLILRLFHVFIKSLDGLCQA
jgi:hypothetical protein